MIKNYFKIAWRNILKNKGLFFINVIGLAIGIGTCLIITLFVIDELSYDRYNEKVDQIARVIIKAKLGDEIINEPAVPAPVAQTLAREFPEILKSTRVYTAGTPKVTYNENTLRNGRFTFVDEDFFEIFTLPLIQGDPTTALTQPNTVVLTKAQAQIYFGDEDPIGKTIKIESVSFFGNDGYMDNDGQYTVTGIIEEVPENSHFHYDLFASMASNQDADNQSWLSGSYSSYVLLDKNADFKEFEAKLPAVVVKYMGSQLKNTLGMSYEEFIESGNEMGLYMEPLTEVHFSESKYDDTTGGDKKTVYMFGAIALFMLLIACINFMNLSTAGASKRVKEIGMRKVLGSNKKQLVIQFLTESFISTVIAMVVGILLFVLVLPLFNDLSGKSFEFSQIVSPQILLALAGLTLFISLFSGAYPAFFMSSFKPIQALKNKFTAGSSKGIRGGLVIFQFAVSVTLIIGTLVVSEQMNFIQNKDIGYEREKLIVIGDAGRLGNDLIAFKDQMMLDPRVENITISSFIPAGPTDNNGTTVTTNHEIPQILRANVYKIDEAYIPTLGMEIVAGRNFSIDFGAEDKNVIINETAIKTFGLKVNPLGESLTVSTDANGNREILTIVGVVKDFHSRSLHDVIEPLLMQYNPYYGLIVKAKTADTADLVASMESKWKAFGSGEVFEYTFLDELFNETYLKEANMNVMLRIFALLTIFVACLGLFGLVTFTAEQRFKEIGIRKVLGSSVLQIVSMLTKDFLRLVMVSMGIAFPLGYYFMNKWLQGFAYRIDIEWWVYAAAGLATVFIAFLTISYRSIQAAQMNPIKSLQAE